MISFQAHLARASSTRLLVCSSSRDIIMLRSKNHNVYRQWLGTNAENTILLARSSRGAHGRCRHSVTIVYLHPTALCQQVSEGARGRMAPSTDLRVLSVLQHSNTTMAFQIQQGPARSIQGRSDPPSFCSPPLPIAAVTFPFRGGGRERVGGQGESNQQIAAVSRSFSHHSSRVGGPIPLPHRCPLPDHHSAAQHPPSASRPNPRSSPPQLQASPRHPSEPAGRVIAPTTQHRLQPVHVSLHVRGAQCFAPHACPLPRSRHGSALSARPGRRWARSQQPSQTATLASSHLERNVPATLSRG